MATPTGLSGSAAISLVRLYTNETTYPVDANILTFLNRAVEEVSRAVGGPRLWGQYPTVANQTYVVLNSDVLDVVSANFSQGNANASNTGSASPLSQGALVYPMMQLDQATFMDAAAGFPAVGFGPPQAYFVYQDQGTAPGTTLPTPSAPTLASVAGTSNGATVYVKVTYVNANGETTPSTASSFTPTSTAYQTLVESPQAVSNATSYNVYASATSGGTYYLQGSGNALGSTFTIPNPLITSGTTPPVSNTATGAGTGGELRMQLYPAATIGQVNVYYRARPQLWADTSTTSYTNLDSSAQEAVIQRACMMVLFNRGRGQEAQALWKPQYDQMIESLQDSMNRRVVPKSGQVRDVRNRAFPSGPYFLTGGT